jgi:nitroreductase
MSDIGLFDAIYTARALRRLKPDPVAAEVIEQVLDAAIRAPSGGNAQNWIFIVVRDEAQRRRLGAVYRKASDEVGAIYAARGRPAHLTERQYRLLMQGGAYLWEHLGDAPVLLVPCLKARDMPAREAADVFTFALMPIGYPEGKYGPMVRRPVAEVTFADRWGEPWRLR